MQTQDGGCGHTVLLRDRRALELIAFYDAHTQMSPNEAFPISIDGHVQSRSDEVRLCGDAVTFHVGPQVRMWGGKMVRALLREYAQQYGPRPWLGEEFRGREGGGMAGRAAADSKSARTNGQQGKRRSHRKRRIAVKAGSDG